MSPFYWALIENKWIIIRKMWLSKISKYCHFDTPLSSALSNTKPVREEKSINVDKHKYFFHKK